MYYDEDIMVVGLWLFMYTDLLDIFHENAKVKRSARFVSFIWTMMVMFILFLQMVMCIKFYFMSISDIKDILSIYVELVDLHYIKKVDISNYCNELHHSIPTCEAAKSLTLNEHVINSDGEYVRTGLDLVVYLCLSAIGAVLIMSGLS